jgi:heme O synthase-like polyprenyltransferase
MTARLLAVAAAHARILARRRSAVALLALLPLAFYGALYRHSPNAVAVGGVASAFSAGGAAIFSMLPARGADQRLSLAGYRPVARQGIGPRR